MGWMRQWDGSMRKSPLAVVVLAIIAVLVACFVPWFEVSTADGDHHGYALVDLEWIWIFMIAAPIASCVSLVPTSVAPLRGVAAWTVVLAAILQARLSLISKSDVSRANQWLEVEGDIGGTPLGGTPIHGIVDAIAIGPAVFLAPLVLVLLVGAVVVALMYDD